MKSWSSPNKGKLKRKVATYQRDSVIGDDDFFNGSLKADRSTAVQKNKNLAHLSYIGERKGVEYQVIESLTDDGFSGGNTKRPGFQRLLELIEMRAVDTVIAADLPRLSRSVPDFLNFLQTCKEHEVDLIIPGIDFDTDSPYGELVVTILTGISAFERGIASHRQKSNNLRRLIDDGRINGAAELLGLFRDPSRLGHFIRNEEGMLRAEAVFKLYLKHTSRAATVEAVRAAGIKAPKDKKNPNGREFTLGTLDSMLFNVSRRYCGLWFLNYQNKHVDPSTLPESKRFREIPLPHGPIIDLNLLTKVQGRLDAEGTHKHKAGTDRFVYLLSPVLFFEDDRHFTGQGPKGGAYRYYWCENKDGKYPDDCRIECAQLDNAVIARIKSFFLNNERFATLVKEAIKIRQTELPKVETELRAAKDELKLVEKTETDLRGQLVNDAIRSKPGFLDWLEKEVENLRTKRERIQAQLELLEQRRGDIISRSGLERFELKVKEFVDRFDKLSRVEQRDLIKQIVTRIVVRRDNKIDLHIKWDPPAGVQVEEQILPLKVNGRADWI